MSATVVQVPNALPPSIIASVYALVSEQRALAYLFVDASLTLAQAGGELAHYGLTDLRLGEPAVQQVMLLEGLLPLAETPFLIRSMEMPSGRVADLHFHAERGGVWILLLDVTAERDEAQRVQQKAYDMTLLSEREAKLIAQLEAANLELQRTHRALEESRDALQRTNRQLERELTDAANYVRSILPPPFETPFVADWRFVPSMALGGDSFGYHWIDADHFAFFVLDVCGHGVRSALLSIAAAETLRSEALPNTDWREPGAVLTALNEAYPMERHDDLFFTIWYGVYHPRSRLLTYASAGHPAAILLRGPAGERAAIEQLRGNGPALGIVPGVGYSSHRCEMPAPGRLLVLSDGAFEISQPDGSMLEFGDFLRALARPVAPGESDLDRLVDYARGLHGPGSLDDDLCVLKFEW